MCFVAVAGRLGIGSDAVEMDFIISPFGMRMLMAGLVELMGWHSNADL